MKIVVILTLVISWHVSYSQSLNSCQILKALLKNPDAQFTFSFDKFKELPIVFIDTANNFFNCDIGKFNGREVQVVHDSSHLNNKGAAYIIIYDVEKIAKRYRIIIHQKNTGAYGYIYFRRKRNEFQVSKYDVGYF